MLKGVYDGRIILGVPLAVFVCLVILILTVGPILIRRAYQKKGLEAPSLANRFWRSFWAGCVTIVGSFGIMFIASIALFVGAFALLSRPLVIVFVILWLLVAAFGLMWLSARLCVPPAKDPNSPHPLGKRRVLSVGILTVVCTVVFGAIYLQFLNRARIMHVEAIYGVNMMKIGNSLVRYENKHGNFPDNLGQLIDEVIIPCDLFRLPNNWDRIEATHERHKQGEPAESPPDFHYIKLPKDAPGDLLWVWPDPKAFEGERFYVLCFDAYVKRLMFNTHVKRIMPDELPAEIKKTNDWLEKHHPTSRPKAK